MTTRRHRSRAAARALFAGCALLAVAACERGYRISDETAIMLQDPAQRHPIELGSKRRSLDIELPYGREGLVGSQLSDVHRFVGRYKAEGTGRLSIATPSNARDRELVNRVLSDLGEIAGDHGVPRRAIEVVRVPGRDKGWPTVRLSYSRLTAVPPDCGNWPEEVSVDYDRVPYENYGCATQRNLAVMIDNPRDLVTPRAETDRAAERRQKTFDKYVGASASGGGGDKADGGGKDASAGAEKK